MSSVSKKTAKKYGGSVITSPDGLREVAEDVLRVGDEEVIWPIVSAPKGWTDFLHAEYGTIRSMTEEGDPDRVTEEIARASKRFRERAGPFVIEFPYAWDETLRVWDLYLRFCDQRPGAEATLKGIGERYSGLALRDELRKRGQHYEYYNGHEIGVTLDDEGRILIPETTANVGKLIASRPSGWKAVFGGYVGLDGRYHARIMERNATDGSAAAIAAAASRTGYDAELQLMKDNQLLAIDPSIVPEAVPIGKLSYDEALVLMRNGYQAVYTGAIEIAKKAGILIVVAEFHSQNKASIISSESGTTPEYPIAAVVINRDFPEDEGLQTVIAIGKGIGYRPRTLEAMAGALGRNGINIVGTNMETFEQIYALIAQAFIVETKDAKRAAVELYNLSRTPNLGQ